ncbi:MAG: cytochrome c-type biogenesis protein CcmH [Woeseiaceae bacterium]|jgi:cytochrome c-type biogenesis protein CcmH|tara:strand:+ start:812 stop:1222 length:411 start_codon:yes stop_codon:yes gene_type:complete
MKTIALVLVILFSTIGHAIDNGPAFADEKLQLRYEKIIAEVRCLVCQNQSIKSSNVFLAVDLRNEIKRLLSIGKTDKEIANYLVERYGEFVLYRPRFSGGRIFLWLAPAAFLVTGLFMMIKIVRKKTSLASDANND